MGRAGAGARLIAACALVAGCATSERRPDEPRGTWHRVMPGETLALVAERFHVPLAELLEANAIADADRVEAGVELFVPAMHAPLSRAHVSFHAPHRSNGLAALPALIHAGPTRGPGAVGVRLEWPVIAPISSPFGERDGRPHDGLDLAVPDGTPVHAAADGVVVYAGDRLRGYGRLVIVRHDDRVATVYAHNGKLLVAEGQRVRAGDTLSLSGHSGNATAPHLHFEVREDGVALDPAPLLPPLAAVHLRR